MSCFSSYSNGKKKKEVKLDLSLNQSHRRIQNPEFL